MNEVRPELVLWQAYCNKKMELEDAQDEIEKLREAIKMALDCIKDVDVIGARQTLAKALGEKE
jgi:hypothetical protein